MSLFLGTAICRILICAGVLIGALSVFSVLRRLALRTTHRSVFYWQDSLCFLADSEFPEMDGYVQVQCRCKTRTRGLFYLIGMMITVVLSFQTFSLPLRLSPLFPAIKMPLLDERIFPSKVKSTKSMISGRLPLLSDSWNSHVSVDLTEMDTAEVSDTPGEASDSFRIWKVDEDTGRPDGLDDDLEKDDDPHEKLPLDLEDRTVPEKMGDSLSYLNTTERTIDKKSIGFLEKLGGLGNSSINAMEHVKSDPTLVFEQQKTVDNLSLSTPAILNGHAMIVESIITLAEDTIKTVVSSVPQEKRRLINNDVKSVSSTLDVSTAGADIPIGKKKKQVIPPIYLSEMNHQLVRNRASYHSMRPRWSSLLDRDILAAKAQIETAPVVKNEHELYAPLFRNISIFKRSYELMEQMLKVYVYKEGRKPIFHQPLLGGIYASEGWFMKLMEANRHFLVKDPRKAHLFYMPFSSRYLQVALYIPNSHNRRNIEDHLKNYLQMIAAKYPFWNRTGGADHFLVACHDWAPAETRYIMKRSIRALCSADLRIGFRLGKDVSLPQSYVRVPRSPVKDLGGRPADKRPNLAFFAGNMHGSLRPVLVQYWQNKDPSMKIFGPLPIEVKRKMNYVQHMKSSKYCICPRGYEVNSPRLVESIFYGCVPVIISDSYVPPFFEVLNWEAFSVIVPEKDVSRLKEILESIPKEKYLALQFGVRRVQQHFLWHDKPVKYDLFHMILHSIWFNRVYQIRIR